MLPDPRGEFVSTDQNEPELRPSFGYQKPGFPVREPLEPMFFENKMQAKKVKPRIKKHGASFMFEVFIQHLTIYFR